METPTLHIKLHRKRKNKSAKSSSNITRQRLSRYLNDDIVHKSLVRFCTVSKRWRHLIADPSNPHSVYFLRLSGPSFLGFFYRNPTHLPGWQSVLSDGQTLPPNYDSFLSLVQDKSLVIDASSNGYLLCHDSHKPETGFRYCVINPFNHQRVYLPTILERPTTPYSVGFECHVNPNTSPLAPVPFTVVLAAKLGRSDKSLLSLHVFNSNRYQWTKLKVKNDRKQGRYVMGNEFKLGRAPAHVDHIKGVYYWFNHSKPYISWFDYDRDYLKAFDRKSSRVWTIQLPPVAARPENNLNLLNHIFGVPKDRSFENWQPKDEHKILCANANGLFYGKYYASNKTVHVYRHAGYSYYDHWDLEYKVDFVKLAVKHPDLFVKGISNGSNIKIKGFYPCCPRMFFFVYDGKLMSYEVDGERVNVHSDADKYLLHCVPESTIDDQWIPYEWRAWPRSLPFNGTLPDGEVRRLKRRRD